MCVGSKRWPLVAILVTFCALGLSITAQGLVARWNGDRLQVAAPGLHFLTGRALERLHNGATVPYNFQLTLTTVPRSYAIDRSLERFDVSYDLWEEKFKVVQARAPHRAASHLAANAAERWCIDQMSVSSTAAPSDKDLWLRLEIRAEDPSQQSPITDSGLSLSSLIEVFSRPSRSQGQEWTSETTPFRLHDLKR